MEDHLKIRVVAKNDRGIFVGVGPDDYCVFTPSSGDVELGDVLVGEFDGHSASTFEASNRTQRGNVWLDLENWECPPGVASANLLNMGHPTKVTVGSITIAAASPQSEERLEDELLRIGYLQ